MNCNDLYAVICARRDAPTAQSYTARLIAGGEDQILKKVGEEAMEVILATKGQGRQRIIEEVTDLTYHMLVLLAQQQIPLEDIEAEITRRHAAG